MTHALLGVALIALVALQVRLAPPLCFPWVKRRAACPTCCRFLVQIVLALFLRPDKSSPIRWLWNMVHKATAFAIVYGLTLPTIFFGILAYGVVMSGTPGGATRPWIIAAAILAAVMIPLAFGAFLLGPGKATHPSVGHTTLASQQIEMQRQLVAIGRPVTSYPHVAYGIPQDSRRDNWLPQPSAPPGKSPSHLLGSTT